MDADDVVATRTGLAADDVEAMRTGLVGGDGRTMSCSIRLDIDGGGGGVLSADVTALVAALVVAAVAPATPDVDAA